MEQQRGNIMGLSAGELRDFFITDKRQIWPLQWVAYALGLVLSGLLGAWLLRRRDAQAPSARTTQPAPATPEGGWSLDLGDV